MGRKVRLAAEPALAFAVIPIAKPKFLFNSLASSVFTLCLFSPLDPEKGKAQSLNEAAIVLASKFSNLQSTVCRTEAVGEFGSFLWTSEAERQSLLSWVHTFTVFVWPQFCRSLWSYNNLQNPFVSLCNHRADWKWGGSVIQQRTYYFPPPHTHRTRCIQKLYVDNTEYVCFIGTHHRSSSFSLPNIHSFIKFISHFLAPKSLRADAW